MHHQYALTWQNAPPSAFPQTYSTGRDAKPPPNGALWHLIENGLRLVVSEKSKPIKERRLPRISRAGGGPIPGTELIDISALQEMDDLEQIRRIDQTK